MNVKTKRHKLKELGLKKQLRSEVWREETRVDSMWIKCQNSKSKNQPEAMPQKSKGSKFLSANLRSRPSHRHWMKPHLTTKSLSKRHFHCPSSPFSHTYIHTWRNMNMKVDSWIPGQAPSLLNLPFLLFSKHHT